MDNENSDETYVASKVFVHVQNIKTVEKAVNLLNPRNQN